MTEIKKILFAVEVSSLAESVAKWADLMGRQFDAEIHLLHVVPSLEYWGVAYAMDPGQMDDTNKIIEHAQNKLQAFSDEHLDAGLKIKSRVVIGAPAEEIITYVKQENISMIVMGTHGKSGLDRAIFGSVADRVLRFSPVPVLTVNPHPAE
ncbi:MAG: universal stress protein [Thermodesulfobacteriota bacterium]|nr:universal stress protein [Thermodesulfobacteriota bacterium]